MLQNASWLYFDSSMTLPASTIPGMVNIIDITTTAEADFIPMNCKRPLLEAALIGCGRIC